MSEGTGSFHAFCSPIVWTGAGGGGRKRWRMKKFACGMAWRRRGKSVTQVVAFWAGRRITRGIFGNVFSNLRRFVWC